ncbi:MAG: Trk system potassium transporter TrkA [Thiohalocapsa sp.]|uniref:Trk system potassium transporter TrkA n=1 Tax=Thiohalocapsa sp. TaxID=2497641 RepID=UPI0025E9D048|nr:Trk system potassium transporter TrkA [Thiohalocapsa sp.]MCG6941628.1 Trk system potassium transporter TrkA [Thiohalocapsa sp.]
MKIVILGAGQVGSSVAEQLVSEDDEITLVDSDAVRLARLQDHLDLRTVVGNAALPSVLARAGAEDADLLIAVTQSDETNLCACRTARTLFRTPKCIARLRSADYVSFPELLAPENFAVDFSICPEQIVTDYIVKLIELPEALQVLEFADGLLSLVGVCAVEGGPLVGHPIADLRRHLPKLDARITAIYRRDQAIVPEGGTCIEAGDEVFCLAATRDLRAVMRELRGRDRPTRRILIAGGGNIGERLALATQHGYHVKVIERDEARAKEIGARLTDALVLVGDGSDENLLWAEGIEDIDFFLALTPDDENNILSAMLAKDLGARRVLALINRRIYVDLVQRDRIDVAISPAQVSIGSLLAHVRRGDVAAVHSLRRGAAEALELVVHGDITTSKAVGRRIGELDLPHGVTVGAVVRQGEAGRGSADRPRVLMAHHDILIEAEDHLILFLVSKALVAKVERYFQVGLGFF